MLSIYIVSLILFSFIISDLMHIATGLMLYALLVFKWITIFILLSLIGFSILKIFNIAANPFEKKRDKTANSCKTKSTMDNKKDRIITKERLFTQSDLILQKYIKDQK